MASEEWQEQKIKRLREALAVRWEEMQKLKTQSTFWHGKWAIVCHENNVLRKQIKELRRVKD